MAAEGTAEGTPERSTRAGAVGSLVALRMAVHRGPWPVAGPATSESPAVASSAAVVAGVDTAVSSVLGGVYVVVGMALSELLPA